MGVGVACNQSIHTSKTNITFKANAIMKRARNYFAEIFCQIQLRNCKTKSAHQNKISKHSTICLHSIWHAAGSGYKTWQNKIENKQLEAFTE